MFGDFVHCEETPRSISERVVCAARVQIMLEPLSNSAAQRQDESLCRRGHYHLRHSRMEGWLYVTTLQAL